MAKKKPFGKLQFSDAFMFAAVMEEEEICRSVLELVLGISIKRVRIHTEAALIANPDYRGIRLDVYADDEYGTVFDVEMQTTDKKNLPKRSRAYQGQMDMVNLNPGDDFNRLPKSFIIFICTYDPFGHMRYRYTCDTRCKETGEALGDEIYKIFLNTKGANDGEEPPELIHFLKYVEDSAHASVTAGNSLIHKIETKITSIKQNRGMEVRYMLFSEMLIDERKDGMEEGREEGRNALLKLMGLMETGGEADKIPQLWKNPDLLQEMFHKYHIEA